MAEDFSQLAEQFRKSKLAESLRVDVVGNRLLVDVETGRVRGYFITARRGRLRMRIDGYTVVWDPETDTVVWAGGRGNV
ncbi:hypothetical protein [Pyrobaculum aerophilum]|uniref:Uncharacterized protein n=2 Tax=Pyrobaculum aerophilum TaxID=13773 RepID=Q8ZVJ0_PYRAE|nr:hypothetical protein [Pyrobaculum aerophilum]AAL64066.1 hypothetical protein PAE2257 [Pyrobaculum aerophilum str. IM2]MCX8135812.1 hypothetical protein [Pyrobaculum aerophilum]RFA97271.1 hypothetical protein CGL51_03435 [Pyrobaculum aerophilum]RFB00125.1 hypothetical protein CGL52_01920 [Pyrobaculum aerophilum]HII47170.1 hypothetical protein [Pyrobaculum aerophilum]